MSNSNSFSGFKSGLGFDFSQVTGMVGTFSNTFLRQPDLLYPSGSFSGVTDMTQCWTNSCPGRVGIDPIGVDATGGPYSYPVMDLSSVTDIRAGFASLFGEQTKWDRHFLNHIDLSNVVGIGLEATFSRAFQSNDYYFPTNEYPRFTMPNLGLNAVNSITSLRGSFAENNQVTGIPWMYTSNVTNWANSFYNTFYGWHNGSLSVAAGAPLNIEDGVTGLVFPAFDVSAGTGFCRAFAFNHKGIGFMSRDFSSAVDFGQCFHSFGHTAPLSSHCEWGMPDTPSGHFPTILIPSARSCSSTWYNSRWFDVFPEINFNAAWSIHGAWTQSTSIVEFKSWNFPNIDQSNEWENYESSVGLGLETFGGGAARAWMNCTSLTGFTNGLHLGSPTGLIYTFHNCISLSGIPDLTSRGGSLSQVKSYKNAFSACAKITGFGCALDVSSAIDTQNMFFGCADLTECPEFVGTTSKSARMQGMFQGCSLISGSVPRRGSTHIDTSSALYLNEMFWGCTKVQDIGDINCSSVSSSHLGLYKFAYNARDLTGLNLNSTASVPNLDYAFYQNEELVNLATGGATLDFREVTSANQFMENTYKYDASTISMTFEKCSNFYQSWAFIGNGSSAYAFVWPSMDYGTGQNGVKTFMQAWAGSNMTSFSSPDNNSFNTTGNLNYLGFGDFYGAWQSSDLLDGFPANVFDGCAVTGFGFAFYNCALSALSIQNILTSLDTAGESNGELDLNAGTSAALSSWTSPATTALSNLSGKGWTVSYNS